MPINLKVQSSIAHVEIDYPPVNALPVAGWFELARVLDQTGGDPGVSVVVLSATGRGFCAGVDVKELAGQGHEALVGVNRGCFAAFKAVYECEVPVICCVHGFCLGGGIGIAGNSDVIVASTDATFGLPEVDRGALGAATHLSRLVPAQLMRAMVYSAKAVSVDELYRFGSIYKVVEQSNLVATAMELAQDIAAKSPTIIRRAKECLNGIDPIDVNKSYRFEQGFTYELTVAGVADEARNAFVEKREASFDK